MYTGKVYEGLLLLEWQKHCESFLNQENKEKRNAWDTNYHKCQVYSRKMQLPNISTQFPSYQNLF